ncbi:MAG: Fe2+-dependent dioxygenase [Hyphomicrobium sp.]
MLIRIPALLAKDQVVACRKAFDDIEWVDGRTTAGPQAASVKQNLQLPDTPQTRKLADMVLDALGRSPMFIAAAVPLRVLPPMFNKYGAGQFFGAHIDGAIRSVPGVGSRIRTDLSATVFLAEPEDYEGGDLVVEDHYGAQSVKLPAGDMVLYPATSVHRVTPVTRGHRVASFFWVQSMIRNDVARRTLFDLDQSIQALTVDRGHEDPTVVKLTGVYHNLLRQWAET